MSIRLLTAARLGVFAAMALLLVGSADTPAVAAPVIDADRTEYNYGQVDETTPVEFTFTLRNRGDAPLTISQVETSCGCTSTQIGGKSLAPGESTPLTVRFNPRGRRGRQEKQVVISSNDPRQPKLMLKLVGTVTADIDCQPQRVDFIDIKERDAVERTISVAIREGVIARVTGVSVSSDVIKASLSASGSGSDVRVVVSTVPPIPPGVTRATVTITTDHPKYPSITVPVQIHVPSDIVVVPGAISLSLDEGQAGAASTLMVSLKSRSGKPFRILGVATPSPEIVHRVINETPFSYRIEISNVVASPQLNGKWLRVTTDRPGNAEIRVPFQTYRRSGTPPGAFPSRKP